jgi:alkyl hydroperoxide reductase subunit AhpC
MIMSQPHPAPAVCPANWKEGDATIKPNPKDSLEYFSKQ